MRVLITGADGFVGKNLRLVLAERKDVEVSVFTRADDPATLPARVGAVDFVFHLAGVNRPKDPAEFVSGNAGLTQALADALRQEAVANQRRVPVIYTSSTQAELGNAYGASKRDAEQVLFDLQESHQVPVHVFRLPNVFGKWCKPNYNSAVATFCHNIARDLPIQVNDPAAPVTLVYVDDVVQRFVQLMDGADAQVDARGFATVTPQYSTTVGELADSIRAFRESRNTLMTDRVGTGLMRALYATYVSYLPVESFAYPVPQYGDARGVFVEMLKTPDCGQFSYFTAHAGITRGGHYHHTKTEKFLVIKGQARFKFRHMQTGETHELVTSGDKAEIVETVPGWTHDITNIGQDEMVVMLWANEVFDRARPDTFACPL
ncbi:capsular polysaccharide biosynthesis protein CapF [Cupriavidus sp. SZY C1]|uniref:UDP-2-acetamido-2,6-beta-L-arabino-hexul-4-ose reductase n=1 Tax=Cupriavidus sp. SZY C1 TaxID=3055037 RepID=UPI0028BC5F50|nr:capsular polysaccharide biosynthesis protein CapF [Cupriavidus sp. SZY C1]MDT6960350.1 capsular polysaccharide biosynthesis protein CapF [Cupriavidus sp. SZY C1]